jgi:DNA-binding NarL/FixJ family response regulator
VCKVRILVAEDLELWREYISSTLVKEPSFEIICEVVDGLQAVQMAEQHQPTIALLDIFRARVASTQLDPFKRLLQIRA